MSFLSPDNFALALFSLMKLGKAARAAYLDDQIRDNKQVLELGTKLFSTVANEAAIGNLAAAVAHADAMVFSNIKLRTWAAQVCAAEGLFDEDGEFEGVVALRTDIKQVPVVVEGKVQVTDERRFLDVVRRSVLLAQKMQGEQAKADAALIEIQKREWMTAFKAGGGKDASPWSQFAFSMLDYSLDVVAERPELLGGGRSARKVIAAVVPTIAVAFDPAKPITQGMAHRLPAVFAQAAIGLLMDKPELVSSEPRWQRLITGVLTPLQKEIAATGSLALAAEGRLKDIIQGELAPVAMKIISDNADDYLKGGAASDRIAGVVLRATLGEYTSTDKSSAKVRKLFGPEGIERIVFHALDAARARPELFIRDDAKSSVDDTLRTSLSSIANLFMTGGRVNPLDGALATSLYCIGLDAVSTYLIARVKAGPNSSLQGQLGAELATFLIRDIVDGIKSAATSPSGGNGLTALSERIGKEKLGDIFKIIADYAAQSPNVFLGKDKNPFVVNVAKLITAAILDDEDGLLTTEQWKTVALASVDAALENPNTLFGKFFDGPEDDVVARRIIRLLLHKAKENFDTQKSTTGQVFFGKVLEEAIVATLDAASTGVLNILTEKAKVDEHLRAVEGLIDRLNALAASKDPSLIIGSRDWIRIYTRYVADVLHRGKIALDDLPDRKLIDVIMDNSLRTSQPEGAG